MAYPKLKERLTTAGILIAGFIALLVAAELSCYGRTVLLGFGILVIGGAAWEVSVFSAPRDDYPGRAAYFTCCFVAPLVVFLSLIASAVCIGLSSEAALSKAASGFTLAVFCCFACIVVFSRESFERGRAVAQDVFLAATLVGFCGSCILALSSLPDGARALFWLALVVCVNDAAAYFTGVKVGGPKLAPLVSPGKTVSGAAGGLLGGMIVGMLAGNWCLGLSLTASVALALSTVIAAQLGDLAKSYLKRLHRVKDSGNILPGHGGILDRIDGILSAAPVVLTFIVNR